MRRLFVDKPDKILKIIGDDHKHLSLVLRSKVGEHVVVSCDDEGFGANCFDITYVIKSISKNETILEYLTSTHNLTEPSIKLTLFSAILKGDKNEAVVKMCTELGVKEIVPFTSEFVSAHKDSYKQERIQKIMLEAAKQSGRGYVPKVRTVVSFNAMCDMASRFDLVLFLYEGETVNDAQTFLRSKFSGCSVGNSPQIKNIAMIVGSEGGFSKKEVGALVNKGVVPVTIGRRILRAETACVVAVSLVLYEAGQMKQ